MASRQLFQRDMNQRMPSAVRRIGKVTAASRETNLSRPPCIEILRLTLPRIYRTVSMVSQSEMTLLADRTLPDGEFVHFTIKRYGRSNVEQCFVSRLGRKRDTKILAQRWQLKVVRWCQRFVLVKQPDCSLHGTQHASRRRKKSSQPIKPVAQKFTVERGIMRHHLSHLKDSAVST